MINKRHMGRIIPFLILIILIPLRNTITADGFINTTLDVEHGRTGYIHVPTSYDAAADPVPLLIALHTTASSGQAMAAITGLDDAAEDQGFIAVFPDADGYTWADDINEIDKADDVDFIDTLIDSMSEAYNIDSERVYLVGWGNGGLMTYRLACEMPERFAGAAVVGPLMWGHHQDGCPESPEASLNMLMIYGDADYIYTAETHEYPAMFPDEYPLPIVLGKADTLAFWTDRQGCTETFVSENSAIHTNECADGVRVAMYALNGGRQSWPRVGDYALNPFGVDAATMITAFFAGDENWAVEQPVLEDKVRSYVLYVPTSYDPAVPMPVMMVLHGRFGSGAGTAAYTDMNRLAEAYSFIAVYPDGLLNPAPTHPHDTGWNYTVGIEGLDYGGPDDAAFLRDLLDDLEKDLNLDRSRVYVSGMSNGGFMVNYLACVDADVYAGFASVAGSASTGLSSQCAGNVQPVPILLIHGTADNNILWDGISQSVNGQDVWLTYPIPELFGFWAAHNHCDMENLISQNIESTGLSPETQVRRITMPDCMVGGETMLYGVINGGHNWPGAPSGLPESVMGRVNMDIDAGEVMWEFFNDQQLTVASE